MELPNRVQSRVEALCAQGDALAEARRFPEALGPYRAAWDLLPEPRTDWEAATWILGAIGDAHFFLGDHVACRSTFGMAMTCPDAIGNPFLHLRLGQSSLELRDPDRAADELMRAYMGGGAEIFAAEDPKYFAFLKTRAKPPPSGW